MPKIDFALTDDIEELIEEKGIENVLYSIRQICVMQTIKNRADKKWGYINQVLRQLVNDKKIFDQKEKAKAALPHGPSRTNS